MKFLFHVALFFVKFCKKMVGMDVSKHFFVYAQNRNSRLIFWGTVAASTHQIFFVDK